MLGLRPSSLTKNRKLRGAGLPPFEGVCPGFCLSDLCLSGFFGLPLVDW